MIVHPQPGIPGEDSDHGAGNYSPANPYPTTPDAAKAPGAQRQPGKGYKPMVRAVKDLDSRENAVIKRLQSSGPHGGPSHGASR